MSIETDRTSILVTGGAGFIGANFVLHWLKSQPGLVVNLDRLSYAGSLNNLRAASADPRYRFVRGDIGNRALVSKVLHRYRPAWVVNFAAETHVDRSIHSPQSFVRTNINGTFNLLEESRRYWQKVLGLREQELFRFVHVSTDEVFGTLGTSERLFTESSPYRPNSPYSASKAAADHLVRSYFRTYGLPTIITNCSNNYGPYQYPEKFIPIVILNALADRPIPVYGSGQNVRDWLYVLDHCQALIAVVKRGERGESYNIGGRAEKTNLEVAKHVCITLDEVRPRPRGTYQDLIQHVSDRPGHDLRYAIDPTKIETELGWRAATSFASGIRQTIDWYVSNSDWVEYILRREDHNAWLRLNYEQRSAQ